MKKGQFVRGSKTLGLFVVTSVLLAQLFVGGVISTASAQSEQAEVTAPEPQVVVEETTPVVVPPTEAPVAPETPTETSAPTPTPEETPATPLTTETTPVDSTTDSVVTETTTQDPTPVEPATEPAPETFIAAVSAPTLTTDKDDYHPGETATIFGKFFGALQHVVLKIFGTDENNGAYTEEVQNITTDEQGSFVTTYILDNIYRPIYNLIVSDDQGTELATGSFLDSVVGPNMTAVGANVTGIGNTAWTSTSNIASDNNLYSSVVLSNSSAVSNYLRGTSTSFAIPAGATINGIQVTVGRYSSNVSGNTRVRDNDVRLVKAGVLVGTNHGNLGVDWPQSEAAITYGGVSDLWGTTWTPADINNPNFGAEISVLNATTIGNSYTANVDYIQITVTYTLLVPDLSITKTNTVGGVAGAGSTFNWQLAVSNIGSTSTTFTNGQTIVTDQLPTTGLTYTISTTTSGITGVMNCSITSNDLSCVSVGNVTMAVGATSTITISTTPSAVGVYTNPRAAGVCTVATVSGETNTANNTCTSNAVTVSVLPDLIVSKTNSLGSSDAVVGTPFNWVLSVANIGVANASFGPGWVVLRDSLPATTTATYGTPTVTLDPGVTGSLSCSVIVSNSATNNTLECQSGASLVIPQDLIATITIPVTPLSIGTLNNPRAGGVCVVDPTGIIAETSTINNGCADNVVVTDPVAPTVVSITRASTSPSNATNAVWTVLFSEAVTGVGTADFILVNGGLTAPAISTVTGGGTTWTVTASTGSGQGTLGLNLVDDDTIIDTASNKLSGVGLGNGNLTGEVYTIDRVVPTVTVNQAVGQIDPTNTASVVFSVVFSEPIIGLATNDITIGGTAGGSKTATISTTSATTFDVTVTWTPSTAGTVTASMLASRVTDSVGNANTASGSTDNTVQYNLPTFNITATAGAGGTITPSGVTAVTQGTSPAYVIAPITGNIVADVLVDGGSQGRVQNYTFSNVTTTHTITASFDAGWTAPTAATTITSGGSANTPASAFSSNNVYTVFDNDSDVIDFTTFGLVIPTGATIDGIEVAVEGYRDSGGTPRVFSTNLSWNNGTTFATAKTGTDLTTSERTVVLGSPTDKWGRTWTPSDFATGAFRVRIDPISASGNLNIDQIQVKVSYTADTLAPVLTQITPVPALTNDNTPNYTFSSTEAGTVVYGGDCASVSTTATVGNNTKTWSTLSDGPHSNCTVAVTDAAGNTSLPLAVSSFTVDTQAPVITVLGNNPETVSFGSTYTDAGATATEGATVATTGSVNTSIVGDYTLNYNATDGAGNPAVQASRLVHVVKASQAITFGALAGKTYGDADFAVSATADSGLTVSFTSTGDCTNTGSTVHITGAGSCTVTAHQAGNASYNPATDVPQTFAIAQAPSVTVVSCPSGVVYDGSAQTPCTATVTGFGGLNQLISVTHTNNTDVGTANASAIFAGDTNHAGSNDAKTFEITLATSTTVVTCTTSEVFTGSPITPCSVSVTGAGALSLTPAPVYADNTNVGSASASYTFAGDANHSGSTDSKNFTITPKAITVTADAKSKVFGAPDPALSYVSSDPSAPFVGALTREVGENVGTYAINQGTLSAGTNYSISYTGALLTITKADAIVTVTGFTGNYDSNAHGASGSATGVLGADLSASLDFGASFTNVPGGTANWTFTGGQNYNDQSGSVAIVINKATPTIVVTPYAVTYDGAPHTAVGSATGVGATSLSGLDLSGTTHTSAGTYASDAWIFTDVTGNYTNDAGTVSDSIAKASAIIVVTPYAVAYDANEHTGTGIATGVNSEDLSGLLDLSGTAHTNAGTYASDAWIFAGDTNYNSANGTVSDSISKITASVTPDAKTKVYGESDPTFTGTLVGFNPADTVTASYSRVAGENVGTHAISATLSPIPALLNYDITYNTADLTITKASLTVTADDQSKVYGGADPALTQQITSGALVLGDSISGSLTRDAGETFGAYPITQGTVTAGGNYDLTFVPGTLTITKKSASVAPDAKTKVYGAGEPALTGVLSGFLGGDNVTATYARTTGEDVGTYTISATLAPIGVLGNYDITSSTANFDITKAPLEIKANDANKVYGEANPAFSASYTGFQNGDDARDLLTPTVLTTIADETSVVGTYPITAIGATSANYEIAFVPGTLTVTEASSLTTLTCPANVTYNGLAQEPCTATVVGDGGLSQNVPVVYTNNTDAGTAHAVATFAGDSNHTGSSDTKDFTIDPKTLTVTANTQTRVYGDADPALTYGSSEAMTFTGVLERESGENADTYAITQGTLDAGDNYVIAFIPANFTITKRPVTLTVDSVSKTFGDTDPLFTTHVTSGSIVFGVIPSGNPARVPGENVGTYAIGQGTVDLSGNYLLTVIPGVFTIDAKDVNVLVTSGQSKVFGSADPALLYTADPLVGSDVWTGTLHRTAGEDIGSYPVVQGTITPGSNYAVHFTGGSFTITAKGITVTADAKSKVFGAVDPALTYVSSDLGATFIGGLSRVAGEDVGTYAIGQNDLSAGPNYTITFTPADLTVTQAASITTVVCPVSQVYTGSAVSPCSISVTGAGGLSLTPTPVYANNVNVGTANASYAFTGDTNHTGSTDAKTFTITQASATIDLTNLAQTYDGTQKSATVTTVPNGLSVSVTYDGSATLPTNTGSYAVVATITDPNYTGSDTDTLVISPASSLTVVTCPVSVAYNGGAQTPCSANVTGIGGLNAPVAVVHTNNTNVGTAGASATFAGDLNHTGSTDADSFTITQASATVTISNLFQFYDGTPKPVTVITNPLGLSVNVIYSTTSVATITPMTNVGNYGVSATIADPNYSGSDTKVMTIYWAQSTTTVTCPASVVYAGSAQTPCTASVSGPGGLNQSVPVSYTNNTNVGTAHASATFPNNANYVGSSDEKTFTILDGVAPVITPHADVIAEATNSSGAVVTYVTPTSTDNVDGLVPVACIPVSGSLFGFGTTTVLCDAHDIAGNHAAQTSFKVIVVDTTKPVIAAHADVMVATTSTSEIVAYVNPTGADSVDGSVAVNCLPAIGANFLLGSTTVTCSVTDAHGNSAIPTTFTVGVTQIAPVISLEITNGVSTSSATITWTTDHPATSRVVYDTVSHTLGAPVNYGYAFSTVVDNTLVTLHSVTITGLTPATNYYFRTVSHGSPEAVSPQISTTTLALPVVVPAKGGIIVVKNAVGDNGTFTFGGTASSSFSITTVGGTGQSNIPNLTPGTYSVTETVPSGWTLTNNGCSSVVVAVGATTTCTITNTKQGGGGGGGGNAATGTISGMKFEDKNGNGVKDSGDNGLLGWTIFIDSNNNGVLNFGERSTVTNQNGTYSFGNLSAGTYTIREVTKSRWMQTFPSTGKHTVTLTTGQIVTGKDFGNFKKGIISAYLYDDKNGNGWYNRFEKTLRNWKAKLQLPNGTWITQTIDEDGYATFDNLGPGTYLIREILQPGWRQTSTNPAPITVTSGKESDNDFGNKKI